MVDGHPYKVEVVGSSPTVPTTKSQIGILRFEIQFIFEIAES